MGQNNCALVEIIKEMRLGNQRMGLLLPHIVVAFVKILRNCPSDFFFKFLFRHWSNLFYYRYRTMNYFQCESGDYGDITLSTYVISTWCMHVDRYLSTNLKQL